MVEAVDSLPRVRRGYGVAIRRARALVSLGELAEAVADLDALADRGRDDYVWNILYARCLLGSGDLEGARGYALAALRIRPGDPAAISILDGSGHRDPNLLNSPPTRSRA